MSYDFSTLNDRDLEELALDLLNAELKLGLQSFKVGRDGGVDLRCSTPENNNEIVVQVKHYLKSGQAKLIKTFKEIELAKVQKLKPKRYIIVTSIDLSSSQKDDLKAVFEPYIQTSNDIFGKDDLNNLLRKHKEVERRHFKLWFSSSEVLSEILNNAIEGRSRSYLQQIRNKIQLYVLNSNFDNANRILEEKRLLIINGMPGIGKTTLANTLLLEKARQGYKVYIIRSIREAEDVISIDSEEKQVFYYDDFLGDVYYQITTGSQKEAEIQQFINRIKTESNKYLILSTRTVILEQAKNKSEKIKRSAYAVTNYEIELTQYSKYEKARILYNHLFYGELEDGFIEKVVNDKFYNKIINHKNYTPRLIEYFTDASRLKNVELDSFRDFIINNLNHPEEIWESAIENQIEYFDRCLLYTLFTFRITPMVTDFKRSFNKRLKYEMEFNNQRIETNQFDKSIRNLLNGFIYNEITNVDHRFEYIKFINPSIADFLMWDLKSNEKEKEAILHSIVFIEQLEVFDKNKTEIDLTKKQQDILLKMIRSNLLVSYYPWNKPIELYYLEILVRYCKDINYDEVFLSNFHKLNLEEPIEHKNQLLYALQNICNAPKSIEAIKKNFYSIIQSLINGIDEQKYVLSIPKLFEKFGFNYEEYINSDLGFRGISNLIFKIIEKLEIEIFNSNKNHLSSLEDIDFIIYDELDDIKDTLIEKLDPTLIIDVPRQLSFKDLEEQIALNKENEIEGEKRVQGLHSYSEESCQNENDKIEDLFDIDQFRNDDI